GTSRRRGTRARQATTRDRSPSLFALLERAPSAPKGVIESDMKLIPLDVRTICKARAACCCEVLLPAVAARSHARARSDAAILTGKLERRGRRVRPRRFARGATTAREERAARNRGGPVRRSRSTPRHLALRRSGAPRSRLSMETPPCT